MYGHAQSCSDEDRDLEEISTRLTLPIVQVVALCLIRPDERICMQQRPAGKAHAGLWEFPGGKVEPGETLRGALVREIAEELGVELSAAHLQPAAFADHGDESHECAPRDDASLVILLYAAREWRGEVRCLEGGAIGWFDADSLQDLPMPPLDVPLARAVRRLLRDKAI